MATFTNQATLTYNGGTVNSNIVTGELVPGPDRLENGSRRELPHRRPCDLCRPAAQHRCGGADRADRDRHARHDELSCHGRHGAAHAADVSGGDAPLFHERRAADGPGRHGTGKRHPHRRISVPAGGVATLAYTARVNAFADPSAEGTIENTVTVTGGGLTDAVTATETLPAATEPDLRITKALEPVQVSDSGTLTYTFAIENYGGAAADAAAGITVTDRFDPILRGIAVTYNGDTWLPANYTYDTATGLFRTVPAQSRFRPPPPFRIRDRRMDRYPGSPPCRSPVRSDSSQPAADAAGIFFEISGLHPAGIYATMWLAYTNHNRRRL